MAGPVSIVPAKPMLIAAVRRQAFPSTLSGLISNSSVWDLMAERGITSTGHNVVVYWDEGEADRLFSPDGVQVHIGAEITQRFAGDLSLHCVALPEGRAAKTLHVGPYSGLKSAHHAIRDWCKSNGETIAGPNWEVYGHWNEDESRLETEVFYLLSRG